MYLVDPEKSKYMGQILKYKAGFTLDSAAIVWLGIVVTPTFIAYGAIERQMSVPLFTDRSSPVQELLRCAFPDAIFRTGWRVHRFVS